MDNHHHGHSSHAHSHSFEKKTRWVTVITFIAMIMEIGGGYYTGSMALLADCWHMSSHVLAMGLAWIAYRLMHIHEYNENFTQGSKRVLPLAGYTSAIILLIMSIFILIDSIHHLVSPASIKFEEAIIITIFGLLVNGVSVIFLQHDHDHSDLNIKAAYIHVLSDLLTSVLAILALVIGYYFNIKFLDALCGIVSGAVVLKWSVGLLVSSGRELVSWKKN